MLFSQCTVSLCERNTHDVSSLLAWVKIVVASRHKTQRNKSLSRFVDNLGLESAHVLHYANAELLVPVRLACSKTFGNSPNEQKQ